MGTKIVESLLFILFDCFLKFRHQIDNIDILPIYPILRIYANIKINQKILNLGLNDDGACNKNYGQGLSSDKTKKWWSLNITLVYCQGGQLWKLFVFDGERYTKKKRDWYMVFTDI